MKKLALIPVFLIGLFSIVLGQSNFDLDAYYQFLAENQNLGYQALTEQFPLSSTYYKFSAEQTDLNNYQYFDSVRIKFNLTEDEIRLLRENHFVVTERLSFTNFGLAFHAIYQRDLPVFVTTDAILHALHVSYDQLLSDIELAIMKPNLEKIVNGLYSSFPLLVQKYEQNSRLHQALGDIDLYVTIAKSLFEGQQVNAQFVNQGKIDTVWQAIQEEQFAQLQLFSERLRKIDFSQFKVRGHYTREALREYFKTMMWLGRIGFFLTAPPQNPWEPPWSKEEIRRMNLSAFMLHELLDLANVRDFLRQNDQIINFMVGESDNLTPEEFRDIVHEQGITDASQLLDDSFYDPFQSALKNSQMAQQKILGHILMLDPFNAQPDTLPVIFLLSGQRFIIDSYIFSNVVYDRIVFNGKTIWRPLPDPLDAMFVLGNNDALYLLKDEIEKYKYASQLNALRYLVESYDDEFWDASLYNVWLNAIRALNPSHDFDPLPDFIRSAAWHQCKLNTQLASWAQLRHDNLLYAKQSYTGATGCSFPYSFVEPYPEFYARISQFAQTAHQFFSQFKDEQNLVSSILRYFSDLNDVMTRLQTLANKELNNTPFNDQEIAWLKKMLFESGESGKPPYDGWYASLFYIGDDIIKDDLVIADVHTQPTDEYGNVVGNVLHVATGKVNLGFFLARANYPNFPPLVFVGPLMSYYETITSNFERMTDEEWKQTVENGELPERPDWVNIYLADATGHQRAPGRTLPYQLTGLENTEETIVKGFELYPNFPNPFNPETTIKYQLGQAAQVKLTVFDVSGRAIITLVDKWQPAGLHTVKFDGSTLPSGLYFARLQSANQQATIKMMLLK